MSAPVRILLALLFCTLMYPSTGSAQCKKVGAFEPIGSALKEIVLSDPVSCTVTYGFTGEEGTTTTQVLTRVGRGATVHLELFASSEADDFYGQLDLKPTTSTFEG